LGIMSRFDLAKMGHNSPAALHTFAEATKLAYQARLQYAGDRDSPPPFDRLLSAKHWALEAAKIKPKQALPLRSSSLFREGDVPAEPRTLARQEPRPPEVGLWSDLADEEQYTTHFVVADQHGNVVTSTQTLGMLF